MPVELHWLRPAWLWLLPLLALVLGLFVLRVRRARRWEELVDAPLRPFVLTRGSGARAGPLLAALALGWLLLALALAGPSWRLANRPVFRIEQPRVLLLDLSASMQAADVVPTRLARARFEIIDLLRGTDEGQFALLAFGAEPFLIAPLTTDAGTVLEQVPLLEPAVLPVSGERRTDLALGAAARLLQRSDAKGADVIVVTDALAPRDRTREAAAALAAAGHRVSVLAVAPHAGFADLAAAGGGVVVPAHVDARDTQRLLALQDGTGADASGERVSLERQRRDEGPWLLLLSLPLAALAFRRGWLGALPLALLLLPPTPAAAGFWSDLWLRPEQRAVREAETGRLDAALDGIDDPHWRAALHYRAGDYAGALEALAGLRGADTHYNRGNVLARLGQYEDAVAEYDAALALAPDHADARHNRRLLLGLMQDAPRSLTPTRLGDEEDAPHDRGGAGEGSGSAPGAGPPGTDTAAAEQPGERTPTSRGDAAERSTPGSASADAPPAAGTAPAPPGAARDRPTDGKGPEVAGERGRASTVDPPNTARPGPGDGGTQPVAQAEPADASTVDAEQSADAYLLRQVPDDPGRLLRERLMLQYLRRHGQLH
jgi:Ca-activated chloride channel family protein